MAKTRKSRAPDVSKSGLRLKLDGEVSLTRLNDAVGAWTEFLREVGRRVAGVTSREAIRYIVTSAKGGSLTLGVRPQSARASVPPAIAPKIAKAVTSGIRSLEKRAQRPKHFTDTALERLRDLARLTGPDHQAVQVGNGTGDDIRLSKRLVEHVEAVLAPELESIGTVEGLLEGLIIHGSRRFLIYDPLTGHQVICYFGDNVQWETVIGAFGKRVAATGRIRSRASGEKASIQVSRLRVLEAEESLPTADSVRGLLRKTQ